MSKRAPLSSSQYSLLLSLLREHAPLRVNQVAKTLNVTHSTVSVQAAKLEKLGLICFGAPEEDNRGVYLNITSRGKETVRQTDKIILEVINMIWQPLTDRQKKSMLNCSLIAVGKNRLRREEGFQRADTAYAEGMLMSYEAFQSTVRLHGLSYFEATALAHLDELESAVHKRQLAELLLIKANHLSQVCSTLTRRELIREEVDKSDRRLIEVSLTNEGRERIRRTMVDLDQIVSEGFYESSPADQKMFHEVAQAIVKNEMDHQKRRFYG